MHRGEKMRRKILLAASCLWLAAPLAEPVSAAQEPEVEQPGEAPPAIDGGRLLGDRAYAAEMLPELDRLAERAGDDREALQAVEGLRLLALVTLERRDEVRSGTRRLLSRRSRDPDSYAMPFYAAVAAQDHPLVLEVVETASRSVPGVAWPQLRELLERDYVSPTLWELRSSPAERVRLAEALVRIGWPGPAERGTADYVRSILVEDRLERGDARASADYAAGIVTPGTLLDMLVQPRFDAVVAPGRDRLAVLQEALEAEDRATADALAAAPDDVRRLLDRIHHLRSVARDDEALALLAPHLVDPRATAAASEEGMWLINEAAYALTALERRQEGLALMAQAAALPLADHPYAISISINYAEMLTQAGQPEAGLEHALRLQREAGEYSSDYGEMWISAWIACALAQLGRSAEAAPEIERMRPRADVNQAALTMAHLCLGDDHSAAALIVRRLEGDDPVAAVLALQDYTLSRGIAQAGPLQQRLLTLRQRPDVRTALHRTGRTLALPLARSYWGNF